MLGRSSAMRDPKILKIMKIMKNLIFGGLEPDLRRISCGELRCRAMFKIRLRRAVKKTAWLRKEEENMNVR